MNYLDSCSNIFVMDEEPRNDDDETRRPGTEYVAPIRRNGVNLDERREDW